MADFKVKFKSWKPWKLVNKIVPNARDFLFWKLF